MATVRFKAYTWEEVREQVRHVNPHLSVIIDELSPNPEFTLYKMSYPFGSNILKRGDLWLPTKEGLISLKDPQISPAIKKAIGYNLYSNPMSMVLSNATELFIPIEDRIIPYSIMRAGDVFGLWTVFDGLISYCPPLFLWEMTAGARSVSMLSKISDSVSHKRLVHQFQLNQGCPKTLLDHWNIFREIGNDTSFGDPWEVELLFFSHHWVDHFSDRAWTAFRAYLQDLAWKGTAYWRNQFMANLMWTHIQRKEGIKPSAYIADLAKHLVAVAVSVLPGFGLVEDDSLGPFSRIQQAYTEIYRLRDYPPLIMQPQYFEPEKNRAVYTSLQFLSAMDLSPKSNDRSSAIADLYAVQSLLKKYLRGIIDDSYNTKGTRLYEMAKSVSYEFYHSDSGDYPYILNTSQIPKHDLNVAQLMKPYSGAAFPDTGSFLRGCVRIFNS